MENEKLKRDLLACRLQMRIDAMLERDGSEQAAITGSGIGISYLFAKQLLAALKSAEGDDWLPMESAPVTGWRGLIDVLVWSPQLGIKTGLLCRVSADDRPSVAVAAYHGDAVANWGVTRWRPLPSPPEKE